MAQLQRALLAAGAFASALCALAAVAAAGGFAVREQSTVFQGTSFAGSAAGGSLSAMFWNSAAAAAAPGGLSFDSNYAAIIARSEIAADPGSTLLALGAGSGDIAKDAVVPASYSAYRLDQNTVLALGINSPFGLVTEPPRDSWAGQTFARTSAVATYNFNPTLAYRLTPSLAVGGGVQIEYIKATLKQASGALASSPDLAIIGDDIGVGFTLGVTWTPASGTALGLGFRSAIEHTLKGNINIPASAVALASQETPIKADLTLPEIVTLSLRQAIDPRLTLLGSVEWTNWSRLDKLDIVCSGQANPVFCAAGSGQIVRTLQLGWHDGWMFSLGGEYAHSPQLTLRAGAAYEISPIRNPEERTLRVPDADRVWASIGASYVVTPTTTLDFAYSHVFVDTGSIDRTESGVRFVGSADTSVDIFSVGLRTRFGGPAPEPAPMK